jgi:hypothetical protein
VFFVRLRAGCATSFSIVVFFRSLALAALIGLLVMAQAYVWPFTALVVQ